MTKLYFLGPKGTYSEQAALKINGVLNNKFEFLLSLEFHQQ